MTARGARRQLERWIQRHGVPGVTLAVRTAGAPTLQAAAGVADLASRRPMRATDRAWAGSLTKPALAAAVMRLVERGVLSLEDTVQRWLPALPAARNITIRMLLQHTAGVPDITHTNDFTQRLFATPSRAWTEQQLVDAIVALPRTRPPGGAHEYSSSHYHLLGYILHRITGKSVERLVRDEVLAPARVAASTVVDVGRGTNPTTVTPYERDAAGAATVDASAVYVDGGFARSTSLGSGGLAGSAPQLARMGEAILWRHSPLLSSSARRQMLASSKGTGWYGLGIARGKLRAGAGRPQLAFWHSGSRAGASAFLIHIPGTQQTLAITANASELSTEHFLELVEALLR